MSESDISRINKISMDRLTEKLRRRVDHMINMEASHTKTLEWEAADTITALRAKVEKLEGLLNNPDMVLMPRYPTPRMIYAGEGITDFMLPNDTHDNTPDGRRAEMRGAYLTMVEEWERERAALGDTHE